MYIDKYKKEDGYYDENGLFYEDAENFISVYLLGCCGCGNPTATMEYVYKALRHIDSKRLGGAHDEWSKESTELYPVAGSEYFMWYWLSSKEYTEHGGSVPGWLTAKGREVMEDLGELLSNNV